MSRPYLPHLVGQPFARRILTAALDSGRSASAYLFEGPPGCGKKTAALDLAAALLDADKPDNGEGAWSRALRRMHPDIRLFAPSGASFKVEQVHDLLAQAALRPFEGQRKVFILDRAEDLTPAAANKLLKPIEEPPDGMTWILVTTQRSAIPATIASRCQSLRFYPLDEASLRTVLERELSVDARRARDLAALSGGSVRLAAWYQGAEGRAQVQEAEAFLEAAASGSLVQKLDWVELVQDERRGLERLLGVLWVLLRERWIAASGLPGHLRLMQDGPVHGGALAPEALEAMMQALVRCQGALSRNANASLALTALVLAGPSGRL
jgi:DNA polymerase III subunit delta'